jgi:MarR family transcriptional regulator, organic hydroperoxide resistance regulator
MSKPSPELVDATDRLLCFTVYSTGLAFNRVYKPILEEFGLTYPQYLVLQLLNARDGRTVGELGEALFLESSTLTPLIKRLESAGLVARERDSADERVVRVSLTKKGARVNEKCECVPEKILAASGMSVEELIKIQKALLALRDNLRVAL